MQLQSHLLVVKHFHSLRYVVTCLAAYTTLNQAPSFNCTFVKAVYTSRTVLSEVLRTTCCGGASEVLRTTCCGGNIYRLSSNLATTVANVKVGGLR